MEIDIQEIAEVLRNNLNTVNYREDGYRACEFYGLRTYVNPDKISECLIKRISADINFARKITTERLAVKEPMEGDFLFANGKYYMLVRDHCNKNSFLTTHGSNLYFGQYTSFSGTFSYELPKDSYHASELKLTEETRFHDFWFFSLQDSKGHNGVTISGEFKVWTLN